MCHEPLPLQQNTFENNDKRRKETPFNNKTHIYREFSYHCLNVFKVVCCWKVICEKGLNICTRISKSRVVTTTHKGWFSWSTAHVQTNEDLQPQIYLTLQYPFGVVFYSNQHMKLISIKNSSIHFSAEKLRKILVGYKCLCG